MRTLITNLTCNNDRFPRHISGSFTFGLLKQRLHQEDIKTCNESSGDDEMKHDCDLQYSAGCSYM